VTALVAVMTKLVTTLVTVVTAAMTGITQALLTRSGSNSDELNCHQ